MTFNVLGKSVTKFKVQQKKKGSKKSNGLDDLDDSDDDDDEDGCNNMSSKTPLDSKSMSIHPRKLFHSVGHSAPTKRRKGKNMSEKPKKKS